jgi:MFS family permease
MFMYVIVLFPSNYILDVWGLRSGVTCNQIIVGTFLTALGAWVRSLAYLEFWYILAGSFIAAIGQPFLISPPAKVAGIWFKPERVRTKQRTMATTIASMSNPLGVGLGFVIPPIIVTSDHSKTQVGNLMLIQAIISSVIFVLTLLFFTSKPKTAPSVSATQEREKFIPAIKALAKNKSFLKLFVSFSMGLAALSSLATLISIISEPYNFSSSDTSLLGALLVVLGFVGSAIFGVMLTITKKYKFVSLIINIGTLGGLGLFIATLSLESMYITGISISLIGIFLTPILPISYEFGIELTYPIGEATSGGILNCGGQIIGIAEVGLAYLLENEPVIICLICTGGILIGLISVFFIEETLQRSKIDTKHPESLISIHVIIN